VSEGPAAPQPDPALRRLDRLVGSWRMEVTVVGSDEKSITGPPRIPKSFRKVARVEDGLAAETLWLDDDEIERLEEPYVPHPISGIEL
jgi:hypothetical protein